MHNVGKENGKKVNDRGKLLESCFVMKPVEEKIAKVSRRGSCRMIWNKVRCDRTRDDTFVGKPR